MKKKLYGLLMVMGLVLGFTVGSLNAAAQEADLYKIKELAGYKSYSTLSSFIKHLQEDAALYQALSSNRQLSEKIMGSTTLQRKLLGDIKKSGDSQRVVSSYVSEFSQTSNVTGNAFSQTNNAQADSFAKQEEQRRKRRELNQQQLSGDDNTNQRRSVRIGGNANLAAQRAIEKAQADKVAAQKRAQNAIADAQARLDGEAFSLGEQALAEIEATKEILAALDNYPEAREAFLLDGALQQKIIDGEISLQAALAQLGVQADSGDDTPVATTANCGNNDDPCKTDVFYKGEEIVNVNQMPRHSRDELDANGWPKYLNVPADCPGPVEDKKYFHEPRRGLAGLGRDEETMSEILVPWTSEDAGMTFALTKNEQVSFPFYTGAPGAPDGSGRGVHAYTRLQLSGNSTLAFQGPIIKFSISHCPGDFSAEGVTPAGETPLKYKPVPHWTNRCSDGNQITFTVLDEGQDNPKPFHACELKPFKRYFFNMSHSDVDFVAEQIQAKKERREQLPNKMDVEGLTREEVAKNFHDVRNQNKSVYVFVGEEPRVGGMGSTILAKALPRWPYVGRAVSDNSRYNIDTPPAYPVNYQEHEFSPFIADSRLHRLNSGRCMSRGPREFSCHDVLGKLPALKIKGEGEACNLIWTEGYNKPVYNSYLCESTGGGGYYSIDAPQAWVCAGHRENDYRTRTCPLMGGAFVGVSTYSVEQCQFDTEREIFGWVSVNTGQQRIGAPEHFCTYEAGRKVVTPQEVCSLDGKTYQVGETARLSCKHRSGSRDLTRTRVLACQQRADPSAHPIMVDQQTGYDLSRLYKENGDSVRDHLTTYLSNGNCVVEAI